MSEQPGAKSAREDFTRAELELLEQLRAAWLERSEGGAPAPLARPWKSEQELALYDATFGARIGWKWRAVLAEIAARRIEPPRGVLLDWGAGSGVAARAWIEAFGPDGYQVELWDRSALARAYAARTLRERWPGLAVRELAVAPERAPDVLLASHVLGELDARGREPLLALARASRFVAWVEPGSKSIARALSAARDELLFDVPSGDLQILAPCPHAARCPALASESDWCHFFAPPAPEAFTTRRWAQFARALSIDLRSLPYSFLVLGRGAPPERAPLEGGTGLVRVLGRPRPAKGRVDAELCTDQGVLEHARLATRAQPDLPRALERAGPGPWVRDAASGVLGPAPAPATWRAPSSG